jgi:hypothetical protein
MNRVMAKSRRFRVMPLGRRSVGPVLFACVFLFIFVPDMLAGGGHVQVNDHEVYGEERTRVLAIMLPAVIAFSLALLVWEGRRLLTDSPFDRFEFDHRGLTVSGLFGTHSLPWEEITGFYVDALGPGMWINAKLARPESRRLRILIENYLKPKRFTFSITRAREVAAWLDQIRLAYAAAGVSADLPPPPDALAAHVVEVEAVSPASTVARS